MTIPNKRPVFFHLLQLQLPVTALVSIAHRVSGMVLFLALPAAIWLLDRSLNDAEGFATAGHMLEGWPLQLAVLVLLWALAHHLLAGLRLLLIDAEIGVERATARRTAWAVGIAALLALAVGALW
jgi:succinate dehydrogenase / fumarate reductase cytochrome b subunit